jgi:hypothetical protein
VAEYRHGRVYVSRESADRLQEEVWVFDRDPHATAWHLATPVRLRFYGRRTRPSRRHSYRGKEGQAWGIDTPPRERHLDMDEATVPLPDDVRAEALAAIRALVTLDWPRQERGR